MQSHRRTDTDLRARARDVATPTTRQAIEARSIAQSMFGVIGLAVRQFSLDGMQRACADLAASSMPWETSRALLPRGPDGRVTPQVEFIAGAARGFHALAGSETLRSALAFWALESDPAVWMSFARAA